MRLCTFVKYIGTCWLVAGCAAAIPAKPIVQTVEVKIPIAVPCKVAIPEHPAWELDKTPPDAALFDLVKAAIIEVRQREAHEKLLHAAALACSD